MGRQSPSLLRQRSLLQRSVLHQQLAARARAEAGVVGDDDQGDAALVEFFEQTHDLLAGGAIEVAGGLVGEDQCGLHDRRAGDRDALALPTRELVRAMVGAVLQSIVPQRAGDACAALCRRDAGENHRQGDVLGGGQARHQMKTLEDEADALAAHACLFVCRQGGDVAACETVDAGIGAVEQAEQVEQRRLARTRRTHHGHVFPGSDADVEAAQRVHLAVTELEDPLDTGSSISGAHRLLPPLPACCRPSRRHRP
jgi:hypothetical protein